MESTSIIRQRIWVPEGLYDFTNEEIEYLHKCREDGDAIDGFKRSRSPCVLNSEAIRNGEDVPKRDKLRNAAYFGQRRDQLMDDTKSFYHEFSYSSYPEAEANSSDSEDDCKYPEKENSRLGADMPNEALSPVAKVGPVRVERQDAFGPRLKPSAPRRKLLIIPEPELCDPNHFGEFENSVDGRGTNHWNDDATGEHSNQDNIPFTKKIASIGRLILSTMTPDPL